MNNKQESHLRLESVVVRFRWFSIKILCFVIHIFSSQLDLYLQILHSQSFLYSIFAPNNGGHPYCWITYFLEASLEPFSVLFFFFDISLASSMIHSHTLAVSICEKSGKYADIISTRPLIDKKRKRKVFNIIKKTNATLNSFLRKRTNGKRKQKCEEKCQATVQWSAF